MTALVDCGPLAWAAPRYPQSCLGSHEFSHRGPTGVYREPWLLPWIRAADEARLVNWMRGELEDQIIENGVETGVKAGFIKLSAAMTASLRRKPSTARGGESGPGAIIGSHTFAGGSCASTRYHRRSRLYAPAVYLDPHPGGTRFSPAPRNGPPGSLDRV